MGSFGKNTHKDGNPINVSVYAINSCQFYTFSVGSPLGKFSKKLTFINNLGEIRRK